VVWNRKKSPREVTCEWCQARVAFDDAVWSIVRDPSLLAGERLVAACSHDHIRPIHQRSEQPDS